MFFELLFCRVVEAVVHDAVLVELDLVDFDVVVFVLGLTVSQVERFATFLVILIKKQSSLFLPHLGPLINLVGRIRIFYPLYSFLDKSEFKTVFRPHLDKIRLEKLKELKRIRRVNVSMVF